MLTVTFGNELIANVSIQHTNYGLPRIGQRFMPAIKNGSWLIERESIHIAGNGNRLIVPKDEHIYVFVALFKKA